MPQTNPQSSIPALPLLSQSSTHKLSTLPSLKLKKVNEHSEVIRKKIQAKAMHTAMTASRNDKDLYGTREEANAEILSVSKTNNASPSPSNRYIKAVKTTNIHDDDEPPITVQSPTKLPNLDSGVDGTKSKPDKVKEKRKNKPPKVQIAMESSTKVSSKPMFLQPTEMNSISINKNYVFGKFNKSQYSSLMRRVVISQYVSWRDMQQERDRPSESPLPVSNSDVSGLGYIASIPSSDFGSQASASFTVTADHLQKIHAEKKKSRYYALGGWFSETSLARKKKERIDQGTETDMGKVLTPKPWKSVPSVPNIPRLVTSSESSTSTSSTWESDSQLDMRESEIKQLNASSRRTSSATESLLFPTLEELLHRRAYLQNQSENRQTPQTSPKSRAKCRYNPDIYSRGPKKTIKKYDGYRHPTNTKKYKSPYKISKAKPKLKFSPTACIHGLKLCICKLSCWLRGTAILPKCDVSLFLPPASSLSRKRQTQRVVRYSSAKKALLARPHLCTEITWKRITRRGNVLRFTSLDSHILLESPI